jgi:hypothetical protein
MHDVKVKGDTGKIACKPLGRTVGGAIRNWESEFEVHTGIKLPHMTVTSSFNRLHHNKQNNLTAQTVSI